MRHCAPLVLAALVMVAIAPAASALEIRNGDNVVIEEGTIIDDDLVIAAQSATVNGVVKGNLLVVAERAVIAGQVDGSVIALARSVQCTAPVGGSLYGAAESLDLNSTVGRNVAAAGREINLGETSVIGRDALLAGQSVTALGGIRGLLEAAAGSAVVGGNVGESARLWIQNLRLTDSARIGGNLIYVSSAAASISQGAKIGGRVIHRFPRPRVRPERRRALFGIFAVFRFIWLFVFAGLVVAIWPRALHRASERIRTAPLWSLLVGFLVIVVTPFIALLLLIPTAPGGLIVGGAWLITLYVGQVVTAVFVGSWVFRLLARREITRPVLAALAGVVIITLLSLIPYLRFLVRVVVLLFGVGGLGMLIGRTIAEGYRQPLQPAAAPAATPPSPPSPPGPQTGQTPGAR